MAATAAAAPDAARGRRRAVVARQDGLRRRDRRSRCVIAYLGWKSQLPWPACARPGTRSPATSTTSRPGSANNRNVAAPERLLHDLQRRRDLPRRPRLVADVVLLQAHLGRDGGARHRSSCCASAAGARRSACSPRSRRFALLGLWEESVQTFALMFAAVALSLADRDAARRGRRPLRPLPARDHAGARRDADRPRVRLPDADRDPVLGRAGRGRRDDDDLRDPAGDPDHGARDPRRADEHGRGRRGARLDAAAGAAEGAAPARAADAAPLRQPDDPVRALDGRDRRADRRPGPRRRRSRAASTRTRRSRSSPAPRS